MLFPEGLQVDPLHFSITPAITVEPVNEELCLFFKWGPVFYSTEIHVGRRVVKGVWAVQSYITAKITKFLMPYWERHNEKMEELISEGKIEWPKDFKEVVEQLGGETEKT